ncbi:hypothetical protein H4R20_000901 [Coemansia guatemalensis]|uniref:Uncharacterized protein n=1 Tax=Coemansia guatemalensis TaxID=2761395 RepID=A0A9W8LVF3_9FUNG|nr:hypothetical protein H4R20_000901 [Coemansia guatemalensis]
MNTAMLNSTFGSIRSRATGSRPVVVAKPAVSASAAASAPAEVITELSDAARQTLAFRLFALAVFVYFARFLLGLVKYLLDATLVLLVAGSVAAVAGPGMKNNMVSQMLVQLESLVNPLFSAIANRGLGVVSAPAKTVAHYLGIGPGPTTHA